MSKKSVLDKMHQPDMLSRWEWKSEGINRLVAVPLEGEDTLAEDVGSGPYMIGKIYMYSVLMTLLLVATIIGVYEIFANVHNAGVFPLSLAYSFGGMITIGYLANKAVNTLQSNKPLYTIKVNWDYAVHHPTFIHEHIRLNNSLADFLNERKGQAGGTIPLDKAVATREEALNDYSAYLAKASKRGGYMLYFLNHEADLYQFSEAAFNHQQRIKKNSVNTLEPAEHPLQLTGSLAPSSAFVHKNEAHPSSRDAQGKNAKRGEEVLSFYEALAKEHGEIKQLPTAAKRWSSLSSGDRANLVLFMEELSPALTMVREARELNREEFLATAEARVAENIALAEREAERMNEALDKANLDVLTASSVFLKDKFKASPSL